MSNAQGALEKYTQAHAKLKDHIEANKKIFDEHQQIVFAVMDAENELRDAVTEAKEGVSNARFNVSYVPYAQTFIDPEALRMKQGRTLSPELLDELIQTQERPPRITISELSAA